jgi:hypothetical protein
MPPIPLRNILQRLKLPRRHGTRTNIPNLPTLHHVIQGFHYFMPRRLAVQSVDLQHIDVRAQPLYALIHGVEDVFPAEAHLVYVVVVICGYGCDAEGGVVFVDAEVAFGEDDDFAAGDVVLFEGFADDAFGDSVGVDVGLEGCEMGLRWIGNWRGDVRYPRC